MKKRTRISPLVFSILLLIVFMTASPRARSNPNPTPPVQFEMKGQIRWKKEMGLIPIGPGKILASNSACSPFFFVFYKLNHSNPKSEIIAHTSRSTSQPREQDGYYVCDYSVQLPINASIVYDAEIGDVDLLPKISRQPYYLTDPWIGGSNSRPPAGYERILDYRRSGNYGYLEFETYEMVYRPIRDDPNVSSSGEKGASPLLSRAYNFAGAWQGKLGEGAFQLILQQSGNQVTGQLNVNSALHKVTGGKVIGNTMRFTIVRLFERPALPPIEQFAGDGELTMDAGGTSFTGTVLGTAVSGTLVGR